MGDATTADLLAIILRLIQRRRLAALLTVTERTISKWVAGTWEPNPHRHPGYRERLEQLAEEVYRFERIARGEPLVEELVI